jgi:histone demethylase JARID1
MFQFSFFFFRLQIEREKLFVDMTGVLAAAVHWEERAKDILAHEAPMCDFEDVIRY